MSFIKNLFGKKEQLPPADLGVLGCDMHSHFIPGIDDGAKDMDDALQLLQHMQELGYKKIITTPHIMGDGFRNTPEIIREGLDKLRTAASEAGITMQLEAAAEYYFDFGLEAKLKNGPLTFGSNYLLFEVSYLYPPDGIENFIFNAQVEGYKLILAHPERYPFWAEEFSYYEKLKDKNVFFQLNINSLTGHYSEGTKRTAEKMIDAGMFEFLGSDCHHMGHINLLQQARKEKYLHKLLNSGKLKNNEL